MDFKSMAIASTLGGSVLFTSLTFTGTINLEDIKNKGLDWANKITLSVNETQDMLGKFNLFKADVTTQLNEKIAKINELNGKIADLVAKVGNGEISLEEANNEIARLNEELEKANNEIQALKDEFGLTDAQVQEAYSNMATSEQMDTTLALDTQNPDTAIPSDTTTTTTTEPTTTQPVTETTPEAPTLTLEQQQEQQIKNNIQAQYSYTDLTVDVTETQVILSSTDTRFKNTGIGGYQSIIDTALAPKTATYSTGSGSNTVIFTINQ